MSSNHAFQRWCLTHRVTSALCVPITNVALHHNTYTHSQKQFWITKITKLQAWASSLNSNWKVQLGENMMLVIYIYIFKQMLRPTLLKESACGFNYSSKKTQNPNKYEQGIQNRKCILFIQTAAKSCWEQIQLMFHCVWPQTSQISAKLLQVKV